MKVLTSRRKYSGWRDGNNKVERKGREGIGRSEKEGTVPCRAIILCLEMARETAP